MDSKAERLKALIKGKVQNRPTVGTDPNEPWSAKYELPEETVNEDEYLDKYHSLEYIDHFEEIEDKLFTVLKTPDQYYAQFEGMLNAMVL